MFLKRFFSPAFAKMWSGAFGTLAASALVALTTGDPASVETIGVAIGGVIASLTSALGPANT